MDSLALPHSGTGRVEERQLTFYNYTNSRDDFTNANTDTNARPMSSGSSDETVMSNDEWTRTLNLNGTRADVRALMAEAIGDPCVHAFAKCELVGDLHACRKLSDLPNELRAETAVGTNITILDIQACIDENEATVVRLVSCVDDPGTDSDFDWLVQNIRAHSVSRPLLPLLATSRF
jgi:hypothetical protein